MDTNDVMGRAYWMLFNTALVTFLREVVPGSMELYTNAGESKRVREPQEVQFSGILKRIQNVLNAGLPLRGDKKVDEVVMIMGYLQATAQMETSEVRLQTARELTKKLLELSV